MNSAGKRTSYAWHNSPVLWISSIRYVHSISFSTVQMGAQAREGLWACGECEGYNVHANDGRDRTQSEDHHIANAGAG